MHASLILEKHSSTVKKDCLSFYLLSNCFYILSLKMEENIFLQVTFLSVRIYKPEKFFFSQDNLTALSVFKLRILNDTERQSL